MSFQTSIDGWREDPEVKFGVTYHYFLLLLTSSSPYSLPEVMLTKFGQSASSGLFTNT